MDTAGGRTGFSPAQLRLGVSYLHGVGVPEDAAEGIAWFRRAAEQGLSDAQFELGIAYGNGNGVQKDDAEAARWYGLAAEQGNPLAQQALGASHAMGAGVPRDFVKAYFWSALSAGQGIEDAKTNLDRLRTMITPDQRAEADRMVREWEPRVTGPEIIHPRP